MEDAFEIESLDKDKILECAEGMLSIIKGNFNGYPPLLSAAYMRVAEARLLQKQFDEVVKCMKMSTKLDYRYYGDGCDLNDIMECRKRLPVIYRDSFPWEHVL